MKSKRFTSGARIALLLAKVKMKLLNTILPLLLCILPAQASWSTLYSSNSSLAYIYTQDGSLYTFPTNTSSFSTNEAQSMFTKISTPPVNSTLVIDQNTDTLIAVFGTSGCSTSSINIASYNNKQDKWTQIDSSPDNWYLNYPTVWAQPQSNIIYIFGGFCQTTNTISDTLYAYNTSSGAFFTPPNQNSPIELYSAGVTSVAPNTFLLIGGRAKNGWISMNQVAVWEYSSWTFKTISNANNIDSRTDPLLIPVWSNNQQSSATSVLILGGSVDGRAAEPYAVNLNLANEWTWSNSSLESILDPSKIDGAVAIDNALLTLSTGSDNLNVNMYDMSSGKILSSANGFPTASQSHLPTQTVTLLTKQTVVSSPPAATTSAASSNAPISKGGIAALSTILPLSALCLLGGVGAIVISRKRRRNKEQIRTMHLSPAPSVGDFINAPQARNHNSWYTLHNEDTASINSWNEKRAQYEENVHRHSTLSQSPTKEQVTMPISPPPVSPIYRRSTDDNVDDDDDDANIFQGRDVQILVSSLRRTPLRVVNPDEDTDNASSLSRGASTIRAQQQPPPPPPPSRQLPSFADNFISRSSSVQEAGGRERDSQIHVHKRNLSNISTASIDSSFALTNTQRSASGTSNRRIPSHNTT